MVLVPWCAEWRFSRVCLLREGGITTLSSKIITPSDQYRASLRFYMEAMRGSALQCCNVARLQFYNVARL